MEDLTEWLINRFDSIDYEEKCKETKRDDIMKAMKYGKDRKCEILDTGWCEGFLYYILNLGTHPTAYIRIPKEHKYYKEENIYLDVHGGITFSNMGICVKDVILEGYWIGWDYGHFGDYAGYEEMYPKEFRTGGKKWTTEEIKEEVIAACKQLKEME